MQKSILDELKLTKVVLTPDLYQKYREALLDLLVGQYQKKDPTSFTSPKETLRKYFIEEYDCIFTSDRSFKFGFLYFDEEGAMVGTFMMRDAYISGQLHAKALETMKPSDDFYDYYKNLVGHLGELWAKFGIKEGEAIYGTNLAFTEAFLAKFKGKAVLNLIFAMFADLSQFWRDRLPEFRYGIWVQLRQSLYSTTMKVFNVVEARDFGCLDDYGAKCEGKLFLVNTKEYEEIYKIWQTQSPVTPSTPVKP